MHNPFESELAEADELEGAADAWGEDADARDGAADMAEGMLDEASAADALEAGFEQDGLADAESFEAESFEEDGFEFDEFEEDGLDASSEFDGAGEDAAGDELEDAGDELEEAFAGAVDAADEDEFARQLTHGLRQMAQPFLKRIARRVVPIGLQMIRFAARQGASGADRFDAMDLFADAAADEAGRGSPRDYVSFLAGLAGRYVVRSILSAAERQARPGAARALGRSVTRATRRAAGALVRRRGAAALRSLPRVVRQVTRVARQQRGSAAAVPRMIQRAAARVAASPGATARLSRPSAAVRRMRARASAGTRRPGRGRGGAPTHLGARPCGACARTIVIRGPVTLVRGQATSAWPRRPL